MYPGFLAHSPWRAQFSHSGCWFAQRGFVAAAASASKARAGIRRGIARVDFGPCVSGLTSFILAAAACAAAFAPVERCVGVRAASLLSFMLFFWWQALTRLRAVQQATGLKESAVCYK